MNNDPQWIWVFMGERARPPSAVFADRASAERWISKNSLAGMLTRMPVGVPLYDWAIENKVFRPSRDHHFTPKFIAGFSCAALEHYHYDGDDPPTSSDESADD